MARRGRAVALLLPACLAVPAAAAAGAAADCGSGLDARARQRVDGPSHAVVFAPLPPPWASARHFGLEIEVCPLQPGAGLPQALTVDADMPAHRHGMNYAPTVRRLSPGRYRADGLLFHMPGRWRVRFELGLEGRRLRLAHEIDVP